MRDVETARERAGRAAACTAGAHRANAFLAWMAASVLAVAAMFLAVSAAAAEPSSPLAVVAEASEPVPARAAARVVIDGERPRVTEVTAWPEPSRAASGGVNRSIVLFGLINVFMLLFLVTAGQWRSLGRRAGLGRKD